VHRDLKPENIFLTNRKASDFVKILDFGIAKMARSSEQLTKKGLIVGTPHYMSPEQAAGATVDARGDIYSLGVILYELATGRVPFDAVHYMAVLAKHMTEPPPPFHTLSLAQPLPADFESIVLRCLAKRPEQRFQTMTDVLVELERLNLRLRSPSRPSIEAILPVAPLVMTDDTARGTGHSVPAAPSRSVMNLPRRRSLGLLLPALCLAVLTGISVFRMQGDEELLGARGPRAGARAATSAKPGATAAMLDTVKAPLAAAASPGSMPAATSEVTPAAVAGAPASSDANAARVAPASITTPGTAPSDSPASDATPEPVADDEPLTTMEPLTVELAPGKSLEIEARTRLSLRLTKEARAAAANAKKSAARKAAKENATDGEAPTRASGAPPAEGKDGAPKGRSKSDRSKARTQKVSGTSGAGKAGAGKAGGGKSSGGKSDRGGEARAPSELMNPWPSP